MPESRQKPVSRGVGEAGVAFGGAGAAARPSRVRGLEAQAAQEHERVGGGGPLRIVDAMGPAAVGILVLEELRAPAFLGYAALLARVTQDLPADGGVAGEEPGADGVFHFGPVKDLLVLVFPGLLERSLDRRKRQQQR